MLIFLPSILDKCVGIVYHNNQEVYYGRKKHFKE